MNDLKRTENQIEKSLEELLGIPKVRRIVYLAEFSKITGKEGKNGNIVPNVAAGIILSQLMFWHDSWNGKEGRKTDGALCEELGLGFQQLINARKRLVDLGLISTRRGRGNINYYTMNWTSIIYLLSAWKQVSQAKKAEPDQVKKPDGPSKKAEPDQVKKPDGPSKKAEPDRVKSRNRNHEKAEPDRVKSRNRNHEKTETGPSKITKPDRVKSRNPLIRCHKMSKDVNNNLPASPKNPPIEKEKGISFAPLLDRYRIYLNSPDYKPSKEEVPKFISAMKQLVKFYSGDRARLKPEYRIENLFIALEKAYEGTLIQPGHLCSNNTWQKVMPRFTKDNFGL